MATKKPAAAPPSAVHSDVLNMIRQNISLASRMLPAAEVDSYSRGNSPGPVDQYTKGNSISMFDQVSNPANVASQAANIAAKATKTKGGG
jgi:hypothetical protein